MSPLTMLICEEVLVSATWNPCRSGRLGEGALRMEAEFTVTVSRSVSSVVSAVRSTVALMGPGPCAWAAPSPTAGRTRIARITGSKYLVIGFIMVYSPQA